MFRRVQVLRQVRTFATEATKVSSSAVTPAVATAPAVTVKTVKTGSTLGQRLVAFTVGFAVAAGLGLYQLTEDVEKSTQEIQKSVGSLKNEMIAQNAELVKRIEALEQSK